MQKKPVIIIAVLCVISLGLGYWAGQPKERSGNSGDKKEPEFLKQGLVAYYPFNGNAKDESANNYHGFLEGPTSTTNRFGQPNQAIAFDGAKDGVSLPHQVFNGLEAFTFTTWLNLDTPSKSHSILSLANKSTEESLLLIFEGGSFLIYFHNEKRSSLSIFPDSFVHRWSQIVVTRESSSAIIKVYVDRDLKSNLAFTKTGPLIIDPGGAWLGQEQDSLGGGFESRQALKGFLDDIRIYNRALTEAEVKALYEFEKVKP